MSSECEYTAISYVAQEGLSSQPDGVFDCHYLSCTAVFRYDKDRGGLQLVEGVKRCDEVKATIAELRRQLAGADIFQIKPKDRDELDIRLMDLENEANDMGIERY